MSVLGEYDSKKVDVIMTVVGTPVPYRLSDYAKDYKVKISQNTDSITSVVGIDGDVQVSFNNDETATVMINLLQASLFNIIFSAAVASKKAFKLAIVNRNFDGDIGGYSDYAFFSKRADEEFSAESTPREWSIQAFNYKHNFIL